MKRFWNGLLFCPLWTNYPVFSPTFSNLVAVPISGRDALLNYTIILKLEVRNRNMYGKRIGKKKNRTKMKNLREPLQQVRSM